MRYKGWRTGLATMRAAKLRKTWRQRVRRWGRRKPERILRLGESQDRIVVVTDRLHDLDWVERAVPIAPYYWWMGRDGAIHRRPDERWTPPSKQVISIEINATSELGYPWPLMQSQILFEKYYHDGRGRCMSQCGRATILGVGQSVRHREEVFIRLSLILALDDGESQTDMSYADFLQMDTSSFVEGWKRWVTEWVLYARVSVFGDR